MEESTLDALGESLAGNNEWISRGIQVQAHESIDPNSEATEVDLASTIGFPRERSGSTTTTTTGVIVGVSIFRIILFSNLVFEFDILNRVSNFSHGFVYSGGILVPS
jgi:hypothetical protein